MTVKKYITMAMQQEYRRRGMIYKWIVVGFALLMGSSAFALEDEVQMSVWVNEAIVSTYTYDYQTILPRQKEMAKYFTAKAWVAYNLALKTSKLLDDVQKNKYDVSAVATLPPAIKKIGPHQWEAIMPLIVLYKNPQYQQKQVLKVVLDFTEAPAGEGVRGFAVTSLQAKKSTPPCAC